MSELNPITVGLDKYIANFDPENDSDKYIMETLKYYYKNSKDPKNIWRTNKLLSFMPYFKPFHLDFCAKPEGMVYFKNCDLVINMNKETLLYGIKTHKLYYSQDIFRLNPNMDLDTITTYKDKMYWDLVSHFSCFTKNFATKNYKNLTEWVKRNNVITPKLKQLVILWITELPKHCKCGAKARRMGSFKTDYDENPLFHCKCDLEETRDELTKKIELDD